MSERTTLGPFVWSIRREIWENRSLYIAPLIITAIVIFAVLMSLTTLPDRMSNLPDDPGKRHLIAMRPFSAPPAAIMLATFIVGIFYSVDALYGERRDRSVLFWKSLPLSDALVVLSKAAIPLVFLPALALVLSVLTLWVTLFASTLVLAGSGISPAVLWSEVRFIQQPIVMFYGLAVHALWFAPIYAWLLLVSAWARRLPLVWALLPLVAIGILERVIAGRSFLGAALRSRMTATEQAFAIGPGEPVPVLDRVAQLAPLNFVTSPGLWLGLIVAAVFLAAAIRLRRRREPL